MDNKLIKILKNEINHIKKISINDSKELLTKIIENSPLDKKNTYMQLRKFISNSNHGLELYKLFYILGISKIKKLLNKYE